MVIFQNLILQTMYAYKIQTISVPLVSVRVSVKGMTIFMPLKHIVVREVTEKKGRSALKSGDKGQNN